MNKVNIFVLIFSLLIMNGCSTRGKDVYRGSASLQDFSSKDKKKYSHPTMRPYMVRGIKYYPTVVSIGDKFRGNASWYGPDFHGKLTSNGEIYDMYGMTAAHKTLPMNTIVKVTNLRNNESTVVRINDRGPFVASRIIDLSNSAAKKIHMIGTGTAPVKLEILNFKNKDKRATSKTKSFANFSLQIASFSQIDGALRTQEKYDNIDGYKSIIIDIQNDNTRVFKVMLKGFKSEKEARDYKSQASFKNAFIVREE